jgi:hypothetical protein
VGGVVGERRLREPPEKVEGGGSAEVEVEGGEDLVLAVEDVLLAVRSVGDVYEVSNFGGVNLFVFGGDELK